MVWRFERARAIWRGFLKLSLVSCPVFLTPATRKAKPVHIHNYYLPSAEAQADPAAAEDRQADEPHRPTARRAQRREEAPKPPRRAAATIAADPEASAPAPT